jgi:hypothetical protein
MKASEVRLENRILRAGAARGLAGLMAIALLVGGCGSDGADDAAPTGGAPVTGGAPPVGGSSSGGAPGVGGLGAGGSETGGSDAGGSDSGGAGTGGAATGGAATGGAATGGAATGGMATAGAGTGGVDTGGVGTGGTTPGGAGTGGIETGGSTPGGAGGAATGGAGTGGTPTTGGVSGAVDPFGIEELYPSASTGALWTSEHWSGGSPYSIDTRSDPNDPLGISGMRGTGTLDVTGDGVLVMGGSQPRIYVYPPTAGPWQNVEATVYYMRVADDATAWGGLVIGARSGPEGHGTEPCDAHTYYNRLRHDGDIDFAKELMHSSSSTQNTIDSSVVWPPGGSLPYDEWIGLKFVIYNLPSGGVKLESYRDLTEGADGGDWVLMSEYVDDGGWFSQTTCVEHSPVNGESDLVWLDGGATFIRDTGVVEARYKWFTVREIAP